MRKAVIKSIQHGMLGKSPQRKERVKVVRASVGGLSKDNGEYVFAIHSRILTIISTACSVEKLLP